MTIGVIIVVTILVFLMLGYRFNKSTSSIQQGGLVQFASRPTDASVTIGNAKLSDLTPSKITVNPGKYAVSMTKKGYRAWNKDIVVRAGQVLWLNYTQLVPTAIETKEVASFNAITTVKSSPNGDRFAIISDATKPIMTLVDVTGDTPKRTQLSLPASIVPAGKAVTYGLGEWANDSDRLLMTMQYDDVTDYVLVDRRDENKAVNVSKTYTQDIAEPLFDPRSSERLYIRSSGGDIRQIDTSTTTLSKVLATAVSSMSLYQNDAILFVQKVEPSSQAVGYLTLGEDQIRVIKRIASMDKVLVNADDYFSEPYIALSTANRLEVLRVRSLPTSTSNASISSTTVFSATLPAVPAYLSVRSGGRFVIAQYDGGVDTYDIELSKHTMTSFKVPSAQELRWLDKYHFYVTSGEQIEVMEFDGGNPARIALMTTAFDAVQSDDGKYIYSFTKSPTGIALQRSRMILP
jgi:hypothetical protein